MNEALIGAAALIITALLALLGSVMALRSAKRLREAESAVGERDLDQDAFRLFREEYQGKIDELKRDVAELRADGAAMRGKLRSTWRYVQSLRSVMRNHVCGDPSNPLAIPDIPDDLLSILWDTLDL